MKLLSWNVNGLRAAVKNGLVKFLADAKPDILALQEIKISDEARLQTKFDFVNYQEYWHPARRPGYSGCGVLIKNQPLYYVAGLGIKKFDDEGRIQTLEFAKFFLVNAYFPNAQPELKRLDYKEEFNAAILHHLKKLDNQKPVIICGDFNVAREEIDLARPKDNVGNPGFSNQERRWADKFLQAGFIDSFRHLHPDKIQYSWWTYRFSARTKNVGWRIDYFLVSKRLAAKIDKAYILDQVTGSDHAPIGIEFRV